MMRRLWGMLRDAAVVIGWLYGLLALLLVNLMDVGMVQSVAAALEVPWLENACWYFCLPGIVCMFVCMGWVLIREFLERRKTRREAKTVIAHLKSAAPSEKES